MKLKTITKKCKQCVKFNKENKTCSFYNNENAYNHSLFCEFDQRKICSLCKNYDNKQSICLLAKIGKHRDNKVLRICQQFVFKV